MIYLDHHATTPLAPKALEAMLPLFREDFANPGSVTHNAGRRVAELVDQARLQLAEVMAADPSEIVFTSGATESNNLAILGACLHPRQKRRKVISVQTEHKAVLDPLARLARLGFDVELLPVLQQVDPESGRIDVQRLASCIDEQTALVSVMLANNEVGVIQPLAEISQMCRTHGVLLHSDASQAVGRIPVDVDALGVDLMSFSAHKFYGPKGVGGLYVRNRDRRVRLYPQIVGGGQQHNLRSGTLNPPGIVGMTAALADCVESMGQDSQRIGNLRSRLFESLAASAQVNLNGPDWQHAQASMRLPGNLNCSFFPVEGQSLMLECPDLAVSSGSACTSAEQTASHVLLALGLSEEQARSSLRFGVGRFTTEAEVDQAATWLVDAWTRLSKLL